MEKDKLREFYRSLRADLGQGPQVVKAAKRLRAVDIKIDSGGHVITETPNLHGADSTTSIHGEQSGAAHSINPEVARCVADTSKLLKKRFPKAFKTFKGFQFKSVNHPSYDPWDRAVSIPAFGKDRSLEEVDREEDASDSTVLQYGFEGMLIHEFAHHLDHFIRAKGSDEVKNVWFDEKRRLMRELGNVSPYAGTNSSEWVAEEVLAEMKNKRKPFLLSVIERLMGELK